MEIKSVSGCLSIIDDAIVEKIEKKLVFQICKTFINIC